MKSPTKNMLRQTGKQAATLIGLIIIIAAGVGFYITAKTSSINYENSSNNYFRQYALPDLLVSGVEFSAEDEQKVSDLAGVAAVQRRAIIDTQRGDQTLRLISYDTASPRANKPYIYEGDAPQQSDECLVTEKYAATNDIAIGTSIEFSNRVFQDQCTVVGFATTPEDLYLRQNAAQPIADPEEFGLLYVDTEVISHHDLPFSELAVVYHSEADPDQMDDQIADALGGKVLDITRRPDIYSYNAFKSDAEHFRLMAYVFPIVFLIIAAIVIFVGQRRNVLRDRKQIGILKAMGYRSAQIMWLYVIAAIITALIGSALGFGLAQIAGPWIIDNFDSVLSAPFLDFEGSNLQTIAPTVLAIAICALATLFAVRNVVIIRPAEAMHAATPPRGRDIWVQRTRFWDRLSFHSQYAVKATFRNKGRFVAMVCGMIALIMLTVMSLGFRDSLRYVTSDYYESVARYDLTIQLPPTPVTEDPNFTQSDDLTDYHKTLVLSGSLESEHGTSEDLPLLIADDPLHMHNFTTATGVPVKPGDGVVLPEYYAQKLGVDIGDTLTIETASHLVEGEVKVADLSDEALMFTASMTYRTAQESLGLDDLVYNTIYAQTDKDADALVPQLSDEDNVLSVSSVADTQASYQKLLNNFGVYTTLLVICSIVLGLATLYSISSVTLLARNYEFIVLRVMGYDSPDILRAYVKELAIQFVIALPIGLFSGYFLTFYLTSLFSNDSILFRTHITEISYTVAIVIALIVLGVIWLHARNQIKRQDLVAGLKDKDE